MAKSESEIKVQFTSDIPKISREGRKRTSKYKPLLDAVVENAGKAAVMEFEEQSKASSRAASIKTAAEKHEGSDTGTFTVVTRSNDDGGVNLYVQWNEGTEEEEEAPKPKAKKKARKTKAA